MIAVDTNILVYAVRQESPFHGAALKLLTALAGTHTPWAIPWPCAYEFLRIVTHPRLFTTPASSQEAIRTLNELRESPSLVMLGDGPSQARYMTLAIRESEATGNLVHDAHIAALCLEHGVSEIYTMDRDFARFRRLKVTRPFADR
ncbi:MAG TPA: TA system VapC family ribonuclease toxin [Bryobacteraceae bacterium]|nr:TA system VapC family ribonuclease toxin [Bryobacteraceae bacterium]